MVSVGELARRDGVSKAAVSAMVKKLVAHHKLTIVRDVRGYVAMVAVEEYDDLRQRFGDPARRHALARARVRQSRDGAARDGAAATVLRDRQARRLRRQLRTGLAKGRPRASIFQLPRPPTAPPSPTAIPNRTTPF